MILILGNNTDMTPPKPPTVYDVAKKAGVSYQTVSRVINGSPHVSAKTLLRVQDAIRQLEYQPNKAAQMLVTGRSYTLQIVTAGIGQYGPAQMIVGVERAAKNLGYRLLFTDTEDATPADIQLAIDNLGHVDGTVVITPTKNPIYEDLITACKDSHYVQIGTLVGSSKAPSVVIDQMYGSQLATQHLIDLGHRQIAEISGPLDWHDAIARHQSWLAALQANHLEPVLSVLGDWTAVGGYAAAKTLLDSGVRFTGLVVGNDQMALGAIHAFREQGLKIPDDVSVIGFDDIPEATFFDPPLTTIRQDFLTLGRQSVEYLVEMIKEPETPLQQRILYPIFVQRQSTCVIPL